MTKFPIPPVRTGPRRAYRIGITRAGILRSTEVTGATPMRHWEIPALLATVAVGGLTSLFAQGPMAPSLAEPTPAADVSSNALPVAPSPAPVVISSSPMPAEPAPNAIAPEPAPVYSSAPTEFAPVAEAAAAPTSSCNGCAASAPAEYAAPAASCNSCGAQAPAPMIYAAPQPATSSCGCQSGQAVGTNNGFNSYGGYGYNPGVSGVFGVYGSGSGVGSGLLSPVANSGGLHARYPYYNYRHSWYYQGPASQNVTIVW